LNLHHSGSVVSSDGKSHSVKILGKPFRLTPLTVALGRFLWLRLPITIAMGATGQRRSLLWGVAIFSIIWDGAYIIIGTLGGRAGLDPVQMLLYPLGVIIIVTSSVFAFRRLRRPAAVS
jgi:hypothetical protein